MTREEAIERIQKLIGRFKSDSRTYKALEMAIQALSQEPTNTWSIKDVADTFKKHGLIREQEPCDDAISRDAVMGLVAREHTEWDDLYIDIAELPSVTQKSGKWIKVKSGDKDFPESIVCSRCNNENSHLDFNENAEPIGKVFVTSKYCPNCGARMVEPQESEDKE